MTQTFIRTPIPKVEDTMSPSKLIIHKYEGDTNFKSLNIEIYDEENSGNVLFGEWQDGETIQSKKNSEGSARLLVKIVSGANSNKINLDTCARELDDNFERHINPAYYNEYLCDTENIINTDPNYSTENEQNYTHYNSNSIEDNEDTTRAKNYKEETNPGNFDLINPLEHSLEKVRENNARIMENINLLNRTLYYTTKKEPPNIFAKSMRTFPCNACGKCFVYETGLRRHCSLRHAITEIQPRWQVVWTCIQCFQVWPLQEQAVKHSSECFKCENAECVREIKTSSLLQCEFCEKVFTSIPRLLRHSKTHTTSKNYECNACGLVFISCRMAEQHWLTCSWLKMCYSFSLPKLLLCNACDRKFRNYDQLYNHRYKVGHFMTKIHSNDMQPLGVLVYQCEVCGHWFPSVHLLTAHKIQCHNTDGNISAAYKRIPGKDNQESDYMHAESELVTMEEFGHN